MFNLVLPAVIKVGAIVLSTLGFEKLREDFLPTPEDNSYSGFTAPMAVNTTLALVSVGLSIFMIARKK